MSEVLLLARTPKLVTMILIMNLNIVLGLIFIQLVLGKCENKEATNFPHFPALHASLRSLKRQEAMSRKNARGLQRASRESESERISKSEIRATSLFQNWVPPTLSVRENTTESLPYCARRETAFRSGQFHGDIN